MSKRGELKKIQEAVEKIYLLKDPYITKVMVASLIAHKIKADPVWIVIVAPSGGAKSEFINMVSTCQNVNPLSTLSSHTFISGQKKAGAETSLLTRIGSGIITFKDMTSLLSENREERAVIMAQLREIYDGKYTKAFGTGQSVEWEGKITVIAGATYAIHTLKQAYTAMGERFLFYNMIQPERIEAARRTMANQEEGHMAEHRINLAELMRLYELDLEIPETLPRLTPELDNDLLSLAELATRARSETERNWHSPQMEITEVHPPEMPTRFAGQLMNFARALMVVNYNETGLFDLLEEDRQILYKLALDSVTKSKRTAMQELARYEVLETAGLAVKISFPTNTVRRWVEDLVALGVAEREKGSGSKADRWKILPKYRDIMQRFEGITTEQSDLTAQSADDANLPDDLAGDLLPPAENEVALKELGF